MVLAPRMRPSKQAIAQTVADVLGVPSVAMADDPFDFGLTSIQAIRICARLNREFGIAALPEQLLESVSVADFVALTRQADDD